MGNKNNWELNADLKIRLNLSDLALNVIEQDQFIFRARSRTYFLNHIFLNAYQTSDASIVRRLKEKKKALLEILNTSVADRDLVIAQFLAYESQCLKAKQDDYKPAHKPFLHTLCTAIENAFEEGSFREETSYHTFSRYFLAVIEDYCRLSVLQREEIYFRDTFHLIQCAIDAGKQLEVCNLSNAKYRVHPFKILADPLDSAHYLACYARHKRKGIKTKIPCSFRISNLQQITLTGEDAFLSKNDQLQLEKAIRDQGVQFLKGQNKEILVRLTPQGIRKLNRYHTLRPTCIKHTDDGIFTFLCTETQAEYYFLKLGADAVILSPATLRQKYDTMYRQAALNYSKIEEK